VCYFYSVIKSKEGGRGEGEKLKKEGKEEKRLDTF
jgi:hypothetical protein